MKKFILTLIIILTFTASAFAASSDDIYVRKDVFDVHMQNINLNLEKISNRLDKIELSINELTKAVAVLSERTDRNFDTLSARIDGLDNRVSDLRNDIYLGLVILGIIMGLPNIQKFFQWREANKPTFTLEDIERMIDAKLSSRSQ